MVVFERGALRRWRGLLVLAVLALGLTICASGAFAGEFRAWWIDSWGAGILSQSQVNSLLGVVGDSNSLGTIREANCNAVIIEVRRNCDACYPSSMGEPYMSGLSPSNFNALQAVINAAHDTTGGKKRIEVHCWMVTFRTSGGTVYSLHHDTPTGSLTTLDNYWPSRDDSGNEVSDEAFDPGHPLVEDYTVNVAMDLVNNFDIDGIHYDYIRFTANNQGYNPTSIARYNARYGLTGQPTSTDEQFKQWRRDQVTAVVRKVYAKIQSVKPWVKQSGAFVTWNPSPTASTREAFQGTRPYYDVYSDWDSWLQEGIVDAAVPMTYYNYGSLPTDWTKWINFEKDRHGNRHMYIGPGTYLNSLSNAILELQQTRLASPAGNYAQGFSGYDYRTPYSSGTWSGFSSTFTSQVTPTWDDVPDMPWKSNPTKGHISGTVTYSGSNAWADGATVTISGPENRSMLCDGTGFYAFIDVTPGIYVVTASKSGYPSVSRSVTVEIGSVTGNMYVNNMALGGDPAPVISNIQASDVTTNSATITWTTDQTASSQVEYGPTTSYGSATTEDTNQVTTHSVQLTGLTPGTVYHYRVKSGNENGDTVSNGFTFVTGGPPAISDVSASIVTTTTSTINWTTSQIASSQVEYGDTTSYGFSSPLDDGKTTSHTVNLTGLTAGVLYHYRVISTNGNGTSTSTDYTFKTIDPVEISNVQASATDTAATVTWTTDLGSTSQVEYGTTTIYGTSTTIDTNAVTSHTVALSDLTPKTLYHYSVKSSTDIGTTTSDDYTFTTYGRPVISNVQVTNITINSATISWTTDAAADSSVNYGTTSGYGSQVNDSSASTTHSVDLTGLANSTTYHYQCVSANSYGADTTVDATFATLVPVTEVIVDNTDSGWVSTNNNTWNSGSSSSVPKIGSNYLYYAGDGTTTPSSTTRKCTWTPTLTTSGLYDVYVYYQIGSNRNTAAPYTVHYDGGQITSVQNQYSSTPNQGGWFLIGQNLPFTVGASGCVELTTLSTDTKYVSADAAKWVLKSIPDSTPPVMNSVSDEIYTTSTTGLNGSWSGTDAESGITRYEYAVGSTNGETDVKGWTSAGSATSATISGLSLTIGSTYYITVRAVNGTDLTSTPMTSSGVKIARAVTSIQAAKDLDNSEPVALPALVVSGKYAGKFYVEESNRTSGIRVNSGDSVDVGQMVTVYGIMGIADGCERAILSPKVIKESSTSAPSIDPVMIIGNAVGGGAFNANTPGITNGTGLYNVGMLVRMAGSVGSILADGFVLNDGSNIKTEDGETGIKVYTGSSSSPGSFAVVTGVVSCYSVDDKVYPMILARSVTGN